MATMDRFVGYDSNNNPITEQYKFKGDSRYTARSEEAADISNWNMMLYQNQYNDPSSQLDRLTKAGLNPLFYLGGNAGTTPAGSGGSSSGNSMTSGSGDVEQTLQAGKNVSDSLLETQRQAQQYDIARRQINLEDRKVAVAEKQLGLNERQTNQNIRESESKMKLNDASIDEISSKIKLNTEQENQLRSLQAVQAKEVEQMDANIAFIKMNTNKSATEIWRMHKMTPYEIENLAGLTNLNYHQVDTEIERMFNFMYDSDLKRQQIKVGEGQQILLERQADGQVYVNYMLSNDADWREAEHRAKVVTAYWQAANGTLNGIANGINASGSFIGNTSRAFGQFGNTTNNPSPFAPSAPATPWWMQGQ